MKLLLDTVWPLWYILPMRCKICQKEFIPNKYHPYQQVCFQPECQRTRQNQNEKAWRLKNPDYFKSLDQESAWSQNRHRYSKLWKTTHKEHIRGYTERHKEERQGYMREYMRKYRLASRPTSSEQSPPKTT